MILVTGAKGSIGREIVESLKDKGSAMQLMAFSPAEKVELEELGVETIIVDQDRPSSMAKALKGSDTVYIATQANPRLVDLQIQLVEAASEAGVSKIVKLSTFEAHPESPCRLSRWHAQVEEQIEQSGLQYTILRPHYLMQNFLMFAPTIQTEGAFYAPMQNGRIGIVDARDVGSVAATLLTEEGFEGRICEITGPEALSFRDMAEKISSVQRRRVAYVDVSPEENRRSMTSTGSPEWLADAVLELYAIFSEDLAMTLSDATEQITGNRPHSFDEFAVDYASAFVRIKTNHIE